MPNRPSEVKADDAGVLFTNRARGYSAPSMPSTREAATATPSPETIAFLLRLARALHNNGYPAHRLEEILGALARRLGVAAQFFSTPTSVFAAFGEDDLQRTYLLRVEPSDVQLDRQARLEQVARRVVAGTLTPAAGTRELDELLVAPSPWPRPVVWLSAGASSGAAARFLGGGWREMLAGALIGVLCAVLASSFARLSGGRRALEPAAGLVGAAAAVALSHLLFPLAFPVTVLAGLIALIPGLTLVVAMGEISSGHLVSGTSRLSGAIGQFLALALGVAVGTQSLVRLSGALPVAAAQPVATWTEWVAVALAPVSLAIVFQARPAVWPAILATSAAGFAAGRIGATSLGPELGAFLGALTAGLVSAQFSRSRHEPAAVTLVPALILLVPGSVGFRSLTQFLDRQVLVGVETAFRTALMAASLAAGIVVANIVRPPRPLDG